ncbi:hypothetical protein TWF594_001207 [Orbilia oligospora]|nr:hypothetical protein TWF594_001207 [Orbilia oligospora]
MLDDATKKYQMAESGSKGLGEATRETSPAGWKAWVFGKIWYIVTTVTLFLITTIILLVYFLRFHRRTAPTASRPNFCPTNISASIQLANDFWQTVYPTPPLGPDALSWEDGTYFSGNLAAYTATGIDRYYTYAVDWATSNSFSFAPRPPNNEADYLCIGYGYIILYLLDPNRPANYIHSIETVILNQTNSPRVDLWTWVDALHMAMPQFAHLSLIRNNPRYLDKMYALFNYTKREVGGSGLWDPSKNLWWRDKSFIGQNVYWSRGNGWAIAALAKVLDVLPRSDAHYQEYVSTLQEMGTALAATQQDDGYWYVNLGNSTDYPGPESSGTLFFIYGITWGINQGFFDAATYGPIIAKAWNSIIDSALAPNGRLMYVQGPGFKPASKQPVTTNSTYDFGVGAFLLAGSELVKLCGK